MLQADDNWPLATQVMAAESMWGETDVEIWNDRMASVDAKYSQGDFNAIEVSWMYRSGSQDPFGSHRTPMESEKCKIWARVDILPQFIMHYLDEKPHGTRDDIVRHNYTCCRESISIISIVDLGYN